MRPKIRQPRVSTEAGAVPFRIYVVVKKVAQLTPNLDHLVRLDPHETCFSLEVFSHTNENQSSIGVSERCDSIDYVRSLARAL